MPKFSQKYTIISLLDSDLEEGYEFSSNDWPLHVTIADTFAIRWSVGKLKSELEIMAKSLKCVHSTATKDEYFGPEKTHVILIDKTSELNSMHYAIVTMLKRGEVVFNDPQFSEKGFLPHATVQKHAQVNIGEKVKLSNFALIDMFPNKNPYHRKILKLVKLG